MQHGAVARKRRMIKFGGLRDFDDDAGGVPRMRCLLSVVACLAFVVVLILSGTYRDPRTGGMPTRRAGGGDIHGLRTVMVRNKVMREEAEAAARATGKVAQQLHHNVVHPHVEEPVDSRARKIIEPVQQQQQQPDATVRGSGAAAEETARLASQKALTEETSGSDGPPVGYVKVPKFAAGPRTVDDGLLHARLLT